MIRLTICLSISHSLFLQVIIQASIPFYLQVFAMFNLAYVFRVRERTHILHNA